MKSVGASSGPRSSSVSQPPVSVPVPPRTLSSPVYNPLHAAVGPPLELMIQSVGVVLETHETQIPAHGNKDDDYGTKVRPKIVLIDWVGR